MKHKIDIIGLGAGDLDQLPLGIYRKLIETEKIIYVRTKEHPVIEALQREGVHFMSFDAIYESHDDFATVYDQIVNELIEHARKEKVIYAVPGHPMLAEMTVQLLLNDPRTEVNVVGGQSYLDDMFTSLGIDPIEGFQFVDGTNFNRNDLSYRQHIVFSQVYDAFIASEIKLSLLEDLPPEYEITIVEAAGTSQEKKRTIPLEDLDRQMELSNLTSVYVPPLPDKLLNHTFVYIKELVEKLHQSNQVVGEDVHTSIEESLLKSVRALSAANKVEDDDAVVEALGEILLKVMQNSQIGENEGYFTIHDVIVMCAKKLA